MTLSRRTLITGAAALTVLPVRELAQASTDPRQAPFLHGVASGDPLADGVILWTRLTTGQATPVRWLIATDPQLKHVVRAGSSTAAASRDYTVKVDVRGLRPFTTYYYAFEALGRRSMIGRTKTAPARGQRVERLRFAVTSCSKYDQGYFNAYARIAEADVDAVLHLGDYIYEEPNKDDAPGRRFIDPRTETYSLAEYRRRHAQYRTDPDLQRMHQQHPLIGVWDDHESANNAWLDGANRHDPSTHGPFAVRKAAAQRVYDEWLPIRLPEAGNPGRIHRLLPYGDLVDIVAIDTRLEGRSQQLEGRQNDGELFSADPRAADPARQMYSAKQRAFIERSVKDSRAAWKLVLNQVLISQLKLANIPDDVSAALASIGQAGAPTEGVNLATDIWDGYEAERERLLGFLRDSGVHNVVFLTGDIHTSWANNLSEDPFDLLTPSAAVELVCTSVTSSNFDETFGSPPRTTSVALEQAIRSQNPNTKYVELDSNGWLLLDVDAGRVQGDFLFVDTVTQPSRGQRFDASWQTLRGTQQLSPGGPQTQARRDSPAAAPAPRVVPTRRAQGGPAPASAAPTSAEQLPATGLPIVLPLAAAAAALAASRLRRDAQDPDV